MNYILTNYKQARKSGKAADSDHATQILDVDLNLLAEKTVRREIFNFKDSEAQAAFKDATTNTKEFTSCFENKLPVLQQIKKWRKVLKAHCRKSFKKIRIKKRFVKPIKPEMAKLINLRNSLTLKKENQKKVDNLNEIISNKEAEENRRIIMDNFKHYSDNPESINLMQMWKTVRKLWPKCGGTLPTAKKNHKGKIISGPSELKKLLAKEYKERLRSRPIRPDFLEIEERKKLIFDLKMKYAESVKSPEWTMSDLDKALQDLKRDKSRDYEGLVNEIFKHDVIGSDDHF